MSESPRLPFFHPASLIATWFGSGLLGRAPGTCGSLAALPFGAAIAYFAGPYGLIVASLLAFGAGVWASQRYAVSLGIKDPGVVVIDEVAGQWLALVPVCLDPFGFFAAFALFRLFDILKTWPANLVERNLPGGWGIMTDDMVAGGYAAIGAYLLMNGLGKESCFPIL